MHRKLCRIGLIITALLLAACSRPFFYPDQHIRLTPDLIGLEYRDVSLVAEDGTQLHAWHILPEGHPQGIILVLHGNAENISTHIHSVAWLAEEGYELLLLDYRGFGRSQGKPVLPEVFQDIAAAADWLSQRSKSQQVPAYWLGQSIGASLSAYYLSQHTVEGLQAIVLDTPFANYRQLGREKLSEFWLTWPLQYPLSWFIDNRFSPDKATAGWPALPTLIFSSRDDRIIPAHHTRDLVNLFAVQQATQVTLIQTQGPHLSTYRYEKNRQLTQRFLTEQAQSQRSKTAGN
jgi:hypothetical protein